MARYSQKLGRIAKDCIKVKLYLSYFSFSLYFSLYLAFLLPYFSSFFSYSIHFLSFPTSPFSLLSSLYHPLQLRWVPPLDGWGAKQDLETDSGTPLLVSDRIHSCLLPKYLVDKYICLSLIMVIEHNMYHNKNTS